MIMVSRSMSSRTTIKNTIKKYIKSVNKFKKIGEYFTPDDIALFIAKSIEGIIGDENSLSLVDPMAGSCNLIHEVLWNSNVKNKINWNNIYLNRFYKKNSKETKEIFETKNLDGNIYGRVWGPKLQKNITKIDIENYEQKGDLVIVNLDVAYLGNHKIIQKLTDKYCFILDTNSPKNKIDWDNVNFSIEKIIDLGNGVGIGGKHYYLYIYSKKPQGEKNFGNVFYKFNGEYQKYNGDIFREKKEELILGNKSFDKLIEKSSLEQVQEELISIQKILNEIHSSNKIITTNFSKLLGNLSISWIPEIETKITDIIKNIQESQKIESKKLYEILTTLTVSNFLILSGPSGVGKTSLVGKLAGELSGEFLKFPIKSNFTDESGLLGYWNPLLSRYEGTDVLEHIFDSVRNENIPYFLLLDEMNLSRIENYFSEFLARIDEMKNGGAEIKLFDALIDSEGKYKNIKYFIDKYSLENEQVKFNRDDLSVEIIKIKEYKEVGDFRIEVKIKLNANFHIVGTINEDETTFSLSNKVLDRAFYISLEVDDLFEEKDDAFIGNIKDENYTDITSKNILNLDDSKEIISIDQQIFINKINKLIQDINKNDAIGYRALQDIATFVKNYKENIYGDKDRGKVKTPDKPTKIIGEIKILDLVLCQKVWPKIKNYSIIGEKEIKFEELKKEVREYLGENSESFKFLDSLKLF